MYGESHSPVTLGLGKDISGKPVVVDLARMPDLLVAGTTGSGKSVGINAMILSILYKADASQVRLLMIDPKMLELSAYEGIPHLLAPVVTDMREAGHALNWCVAEMDRRYRLLSKMGVRSLGGYNQRILEASERGEVLVDPFEPDAEQAAPLEALPVIVVVIDELADMMMVTGKKVEELIARIAQKARAAGMHSSLLPNGHRWTSLPVSSRPIFRRGSRSRYRVGWIRARSSTRWVPSRRWARETCSTCRRAPGCPRACTARLSRMRKSIGVVESLRKQGAPQYLEGVLDAPEAAGEPVATTPEGGGEADPLYDQAVEIVIKQRRASISLVQRHLRIGYNRAARLLEEMERAGMVSSMQPNGNREILVPSRDAT